MPPFFLSYLNRACYVNAIMNSEEKKKRTLLLIAAVADAVVIAVASDKKTILIDNGSISGRSLADVMLSDLSTSYLTRSWNGSCGSHNACQCQENFKLAAVKKIKHGIHRQKPRKGFNVPR